jgi:type III pantothenate kinase
MILTVDIGNTHIHLGLFIRGALRKTWSLCSQPVRTHDEYALLLGGLVGEGLPLRGAIVCSVVPRLVAPVARAIEQEFKTQPLILDEATPMGIANGYDHPDEVGMDRLANAAGALYFFGAPVLVLDFGTAITLDYLAAPRSAEDLPTYKGGAILPGLEMAAQALARGTARLPQAPLFDPGTVIGRTTVASIQAGLVHGYQGAITTLVERAREEIGSAVTVVATGGDALNLKNQLPFIQSADPNLTLYGLRQIYGINHGCPLPPRR